MRRLSSWTNARTGILSLGGPKCKGRGNSRRPLRVEALERRELLSAMGLTINGGLDLTNHRQVTATFENVSAGAQSVRFAFNGFNYGSPLPFTTAKEVTLPNYVGRNYVNALIHFADGSQRMVWDSIVYYVPTMRINNDAAATNFRDVTVSFAQVAPDAEEVRFAYNGFNWKAPVDFATSMTVTLPNYEGANYVNAQIIYAGDKTRTTWDKIDYRVPTVQVSGGAPQTHSRDVTLSFANIVETPSEVQFAFNGYDFGAVADYEPIMNATLPNWDGINYANAKLHYPDGRERVIYDSIDFSPPVVVQACGECVAFELLVTDGPNEGFRDPIWGGSPVSAFSHAMGIWSDLLLASHDGETITISASIDDLSDLDPDPNDLSIPIGGASPSTLPVLHRNAGLFRHTTALANHIQRSDTHAGPEIIAQFSDDAFWYYGTDGQPWFFALDFVSTVVHEVGHGLGFYSDVASSGQWRASWPAIYDAFLVNSAGTALTAMTAAQRAAAITSDGLYWNGPAGVAGNAGARPKMYAPFVYEPGSSVSHLDETTHGDEMMSPEESGPDHTLSPMELGMLQDMGWTLRSVGAPANGMALATGAVSTTQADPATSLSVFQGSLSTSGKVVGSESESESAAESGAGVVPWKSPRTDLAAVSDQPTRGGNVAKSGPLHPIRGDALRACVIDRHIRDVALTEWQPTLLANTLLREILSPIGLEAENSLMELLASTRH